MTGCKFNDLSRSPSVIANELRRALIDIGVSFSTGIPCGILRRVIDVCINDSRIVHVGVNRESEAIGVAVGAYLARHKPLLYMQNSGLFAASNDISSLVIPYGIPLLMIVTLRGCGNEDAPQHLANGEATKQY